MLFFSVSSFGGEKKRASSAALVRVVAAELEAARALAMRNQSPVAVCFPSQRRTSPHSQSLYLLEGLATSRMTRVVNYAREYPEAVIAVGSWGNATVDRPNGADNFSSQGPQRWLGNSFWDYALIFAPDGSVTSNDLPLVNNAYHLLVAAQVAYSTVPNLPGTTTMSIRRNGFALTQAHAPQTISISPTGSISVVSGVANNGGVVVTPKGFAMAAPASAPTISIAAPQSPVINSIEVLPLPLLSAKASVSQGRTLTLKVSAADPNGEPLTCTWTSENLAGGTDPGGFSLPAASPMDWEPQLQRWGVTTTWTPPSSAVTGTFRLQCKVSDPSGRSDTQTSSVLDPVTVLAPGRLVYSWWSSPVRYEVSIIDGDGSNEKRLTNNSTDDTAPSLSPDGKKVVFVSERTGQSEIFVMNSDGSDQRRLTTNTAADWSPTWSPDGSQIFFGRNWPDRVWVMNADGTGATNLSSGGYASEYGIQPSPDGRYVAYDGNKGAPGVPSVSGEVVVGEFVNDRINPPRVLDATNLTDNSQFRIMDHFHCWFPDSSGRFLYSSTDPQGAQYYTNALRTLRVARLVDNGRGSVPRFQIADQSDLSSTTSYYSDYSAMQISPDLRRVSFQQGSPAYVADFDAAAVPPTLRNMRRLTNTTGFQNPGNWSRF